MINQSIIVHRIYLNIYGFAWKISLFLYCEVKHVNNGGILEQRSRVLLDRL